MQHELNISQLGEVELTLLVQGVIVQLQLLDLFFKFLVTRTAAYFRHNLGARVAGLGSGSRDGTRGTHWGATGGLAGLGSGLVSRGGNLTATENVEKILAFAAAERIVGFPVVVLFEESLEPLAELEVILVPGLGQFSDFDVSFDAVLVESGLETLVVLNVFVLMFGLPLNLAEGECPREETVHHCAIHSTSRTLLNLS